MHLYFKISHIYKLNLYSWFFILFWKGMRETLTIYVHAHKKLEKMLQLTYDINIYQSKSTNILNQVCDNVIWSCAWRPNKNEVALCGSDKIVCILLT
ncbi:hypothetical protein HZS_671 [Henneguya salminicola]|nr:hypothetical protein HZS_671 [Henneguya salminicola]